MSPHHPKKWVQKSGSQLNLVPGLNGFALKDFYPACEGIRFDQMYVTPCEGKPETVAECVAWVEGQPGWRLGFQAHKQWGLP